MVNKSLYDMPEVNQRKSKYEFVELLKLLYRNPYNNNELKAYYNDTLEALLCMAIEINNLKEEIKNLKS